MKIFKKVIIFISIVILCMAGALFVLASKGMGISKGNCIISGNDTYMLVLDNSPIVMSNQTNNANIFQGLSDGDGILVLHDGIAESYPGQTGIYFVIKTSNGDITDISKDVLRELAKLGWIEDVLEDSDEVNPEADKNADSEILVEDDVSLIVPEGMTVQTRIDTPKGYTRTDTTDDENFTNFVRNYPLKEDKSPVLLYDGSEKRNQSAHIAVLELPIEAEDLQQCADSIMRIYAEYYYATEQYDKINFHFVNGFLAEYSKWRQGYRISFQGNDTSWTQSADFDDSYACFQKFMRIVFAYAGTLSMEQESTTISLEEAQVGDVFLKGGSPGHVVMILDVCMNEQGEKAYLLAQGYMPAQEFHILKNPLHEDDPWYYEEEITYPLRTPEYTFSEGSLRRLSY